MRLGIDPKNDYAFKRLFGDEHELPLLFSLLDAVLQPGPGHRLIELNLLNPFNEKETLDDKLSVLDVKARDQGGRQYNIEMQLLTPSPFRQRVLYYWAKFHQAQLQEGQSYSLLRPTISICFVNTPLFPEVPDYHLVFALREQRFNVTFNDQLFVHILELAKFTKAVADLTTPLDRWLYFLRNADALDSAALAPQLGSAEIRRACEVLTKMNQNTAERDRYEARQKYLHDVATWQTLLAEARADQEKAKARLVSDVQFFEQLLGRSPTAPEQLSALADDELDRLAANLKAEVAALLPPKK